MGATAHASFTRRTSRESRSGLTLKNREHSSAIGKREGLREQPKVALIDTAQPTILTAECTPTTKPSDTISPTRPTSPSLCANIRTQWATAPATFAPIGTTFTKTTASSAAVYGNSPTTPRRWAIFTQARDTPTADISETCRTTPTSALTDSFIPTDVPIRHCWNCARLLQSGSCR